VDSGAHSLLLTGPAMIYTTWELQPYLLHLRHLLLLLLGHQGFSTGDGRTACLLLLPCSMALKLVRLLLLLLLLLWLNDVLCNSLAT